MGVWGVWGTSEGRGEEAGVNFGSPGRWGGREGG